ncbi:MAG: type II toxin-antitoxin system VapC family toxin [Candidatus Hodarchaeales archaeon]|jgi:predicted nucleic acid-binding protein
MKSIYLDTNVLLAKWVKSDPFYYESQKIITSIEKTQIKGYFSGFGLAEVASVVERQVSKFNLNQFKGSLAIEFVKAIREINNLTITEIFTPVNLLINDQKTVLSIIHLKTIEVAHKVKLKTLDNIHISIITLLMQYQGKKIDYFTTGDKEIISKGNEIKLNFGISVVDPSEFVRIEGI